MKYSKIILICSIIALLISATFYVFFSDSEQSTTTNTTNTTVQSKNDFTSSDTQETEQKQSIPNIEQQEVQLTESEKPNIEMLLNNNIGVNLRNWEISRESKYLDQALTLSYNTNNEAVFENWKYFMITNSNDLVKNININSSSEKIIITASIFEWFIEGSGEYEKLSDLKKQEIARQFNQIQVIQNQRSLE